MIVVGLFFKTLAPVACVFVACHRFGYNYCLQKLNRGVFSQGRMCALYIKAFPQHACSLCLIWWLHLTASVSPVHLVFPAASEVGGCGNRETVSCRSYARPCGVSIPGQIQDMFSSCCVPPFPFPFVLEDCSLFPWGPLTPTSSYAASAGFIGMYVQAQAD